MLGQSTQRNASIFAHGRKPFDEEKLRQFEATAREVRARLASLEGWTLPSLDLELDFVRLSAP